MRLVSYSNEIGIALEAPMAILAFTFCADTYTQEIVSRRSEIWRLCPEDGICNQPRHHAASDSHPHIPKQAGNQIG